MARSVLGCLGVVLATVGNLVALIVLRGHEEAWMCLTICSVDGMCAAPPPFSGLFLEQELIFGKKISPVSWAVVVIHWLTSNVIRAGQNNAVAATSRTPQLAGEYHEMH